jgi:hypothetical protein
VIRTVLEGAGADRVATQARESAQFAKSLGRSVTGSMNELIAHAVAFLADGDLPLADVGVRLNDILLSALGGGSNKYGRLREVFAALVAPRRAGRHSGEES